MYEWIKVSDRLPNSEGFYTVTLEAEDGVRYLSDAFYHAKRKCFEKSWCPEEIKPIAWMPEIEPYKGE